MFSVVIAFENALKYVLLYLSAGIKYARALALINFKSVNALRKYLLVRLVH